MFVVCMYNSISLLYMYACVRYGAWCSACLALRCVACAVLVRCVVRVLRLLVL